MGHLPQIKPDHRKTIGKGLLGKILKDTKITVEELK